MAEIRQHEFEWSQTVKATANLVNDGSFPGAPLNSLLAAQGARGEIVNVGLMEETGEAVYLVEFADGKVVGVYQDEISLV